MEDRARAPDIVGMQILQFLLKRFSGANFIIDVIDIVHDCFQFRRNYLSAIFSKITAMIRHLFEFHTPLLTLFYRAVMP